MTVTSQTVGSVADFLAAVQLAEQEMPTLPLWFRGQSSDAYALSTSLHRRSSDLGYERDLTQRFRSRAGVRYQHAPRYDDLAAWVTLMQHYGLPTRLLDWSRSPLVAAYFAIAGSLPPLRSAPTRAAAVWVLSPHALNEVESQTPVTPSITGGICKPLIAGAFFEPDPSREHPIIPRVLAAMASETDMRMFVQQGAFTIHTSPVALDGMDGASGYLRKLTIPLDAVPQFAEEVHRCGMRRGDLFPDLQNLAAEMIHTSGY